MNVIIKRLNHASYLSLIVMFNNIFLFENQSKFLAHE